MIEYFWSCELGKFVDKTTGIENCLFPDGRRMCSFEGDFREWCETLIEVICDVSNMLSHSVLPSEVLQRIELQANETVASLMLTSVLYGRRSSTGVALIANIIPSLSDDVDFIDSKDGHRYATVHVLDVKLQTS